VPQSDGRKLMLEGVTVLDFTQYLAGAGVTRMMAELGAEIWKIELPDVGDGGRLLPHVTANGRSGFFAHHNRGKKSLAVDWTKPEGLDLIKTLAAKADVVTENFGNGEIMAKRGLDYESLAEANPGLIYLSVSAFGRNSPWANKSGYDYIAQAASGLMHMTGEPDRPPAIVWSALGDTNGAVHGFGALGYALYHKAMTGEGQWIDLSMTDALFHCHEMQLEVNHLTRGEYVPIRYGAHHALIYPAGTFKGPEGWIVVLALDLQWSNYCESMGRPDLIDDPRYATMADRVANRDELIKLTEEWMATFDTDEEVLDVLEQFRVPAGPVLSPLDALDHPYFKARDMVRWMKDPYIDEEIPVPGFPFKFSAQPELPDIVAPTLGQHNQEILGQVLGLSEQEVTLLTESGVLAERGI